MTRVAAVQVAAPWPAYPECVCRTVSLLEQAAAAGARLVVLPELCTISYDFESSRAVHDTAEPLDGPAVHAWTRVAHRTGIYVVAGLPERAGPRVYNSAVLVGPGGVIGCYRKAHLFGPEREIFTPGDAGFAVWETPLARIGLLICYDLRFAEAVRVLVLEDVEVLCVPTTWTDIGKPDPWDADGWCGAAHLVAGYAYANRLPIVCANRAGQDGRVRTLGCSLIANATGTNVAGPAPFNAEAVLTADLDIGSVIRERRRPESDLVAERRPDLYTRLIDPPPRSQDP